MNKNEPEDIQECFDLLSKEDFRELLYLEYIEANGELEVFKKEIIKTLGVKADKYVDIFYFIAERNENFFCPKRTEEDYELVFTKAKEIVALNIEMIAEESDEDIFASEIDKAIEKGIESIKHSQWHKKLSLDSKTKAINIFVQEIREILNDEIPFSESTNQYIQLGKYKILEEDFNSIPEKKLKNIDELTNYLTRILKTDYPNVQYDELRKGIVEYGKSLKNKN